MNDLKYDLFTQAQIIERVHSQLSHQMNNRINDKIWISVFHPSYVQVWSLVREQVKFQVEEDSANE